MISDEFQIVADVSEIQSCLANQLYDCLYNASCTQLRPSLALKAPIWVPDWKYCIGVLQPLKFDCR